MQQDYLNDPSSIFQKNQTHATLINSLNIFAQPKFDCIFELIEKKNKRMNRNLGLDGIILQRISLLLTPRTFYYFEGYSWT